MLDIDLAILGADRARFEEYERHVRLEYEHVPDPEFAKARAGLLRSLLSGSIFVRRRPMRSWKPRRKTTSSRDRSVNGLRASMTERLRQRGHRVA